MNIQTFKGGYDDNFSYIVHDDNEAIIIDMAIHPKELIHYINKHQLILKMVIIMHSHFDHVVGFDYYKQHRIPVAAHPDIKKPIDIPLENNQEITVGDLKFTVLHTPGHIYDCICLFGENSLFTTDCLFINGCGRCDLQGADPQLQFHSLQKIKSLPKDTIIYPGHDYGPTPTDTIENQLKTNPFLQFETEEDFLNLRMRPR